ncbi:hypothetical protein [Sphingomonas sp. RT2P30]|uniref:hypothetical protein n=1 Tax=Parasphingomonas halimpatiens TaxID=3096162 RepID=UPI002FCBCE90
MSLLGRYLAYLKRRATGLSRLQWYVASSKEALPWVLVALALAVPASLLSGPYRVTALWIVAVPVLLGFAATQIVMLVVHLNDLRGHVRRVD